MSRRFTPEEGAQRAFYDDAYLQYHRAAYDNLCANGKLFTGIKRPRGKGFRQMTRVSSVLPMLSALRSSGII